MASQRRSHPDAAKRAVAPAVSAGRVFILESPNPRDLLENRGERLTLEQVCKLLGYDVATFLLRDHQEFLQTCRYVSSIDGDNTDRTPLFLHISVHGNSNGIAIGRDDIPWAKLAKGIEEMYDHLKAYKGPVILILSACGANNKKLTHELTERLGAAKTKYTPPKFIFVFAEDEVDWLNAVVTWTIFYREITNANFKDKTTIKTVLSKLRKSGYGYLKYFRWDKTKYVTFKPDK